MKNNFLTRTLAACQEWLRRWAIRQIIKLVDRAEERLQAWQVSLRETLAAGAVPVKQSVSVKNELTRDAVLPSREGQAVLDGAEFGRDVSPGRRRVSFGEWEMRKSGVAPISKKAARRRRERLTAASFDLKFARSAQ